MMTKAELYEEYIRLLNENWQRKLDDRTSEYVQLRTEAHYMAQQIEQYQKRIAQHEGSNNGNPNR